ncbi:MAG: LPS export ABC transporter periplasmic protein LptC [Bacteroidota bacterium]
MVRRLPLPARVVLVAAALAVCCVAGVCLRARIAPAEKPRPAAQDVHAAPGDQGEAESGDGETLPGASMVLEGTRIVVPGPSGDPEWEFSAEKIEIAKERRVARLTHVKGARYVTGATQVRVRAGILTAAFESGRLDFEDGVEVTGENGAGFSARRATWDPGTGRFVASGDVRYSDGTSTISGDALQADPGLEEAVVRGRVRFATVVRGG